MGCGSCGSRKGSPEYDRQFKPENNSGCGVADTNKCEDPSLAMEGSALYKWEQEHGRLITESKMVHIDGRSTIIFRKIPCPKVSDNKKRVCCCSLRYKVVR